MFTGIVSDVGQVVEFARKGHLARLVVDTRYDAASFLLGASVANSGICLTLVACEPSARGAKLSFDIGAETLRLTTLGALQVGSRVNVERSLRVGDELGGHLVSGHGDGLAKIEWRRDFEGQAHFRFSVPPALARFIGSKGSVALDGTSLTVNLVDGDSFEVLLIPHTLSVTTWGERQAGDFVNLEVDRMARYAARILGRD